MSIVQDAAQAVMKTAIALAPDSWMPGGQPDPLIQHKHGLIGAPVSRLDGPLKVRRRGTFRRRVSDGWYGLCGAGLQHDREGAHRRSLDTTKAEAAPGVVLVMTSCNAPAMKPMPIFVTATEGRRPRRPARHAGRSCPLERPADRGGARRDAGTGRPCAVADPRRPMKAESAVTAFAQAKANASEPGLFLGEPLKQEDRRRRGSSRRRAAQGRCHVHERHATITMQSSCMRQRSPGMATR